MNDNCPRQKKICPHYGNCEACRVHLANSKRRQAVACEKETEKSVIKILLFIVIWLLLIQGVLFGIKQIVFCYTVETLYSRSMVTMISMTAIFVIFILYCRRRNYRLSVFPTAFSLPYIIITVIAAVFFWVTLFFVNSFSVQNILMLLYGSIVTPIFEELLFRGVIWNRLNKHLAKEWETYLTVSLLFALWHIGYAVGIYFWNGGNLLNCIMMKVMVGAVFGLITGAIRYKTKNCYSGILVHGILNAFG